MFGGLFRNTGFFEDITFRNCYPADPHPEIRRQEIRSIFEKNNRGSVWISI